MFAIKRRGADREEERECQDSQVLGEKKVMGGRRTRDEGERGLLRFCHLEYLWD